MLVLGRKDNESILIGDNIRITIVGRAGGSIKIGVQAPSDIKIVREEIASQTGGGCATPEPSTIKLTKPPQAVA